mmetsp:Transcript_35155/g.106032  ORF Transcript_35155/g.106032 Transcript_35155/m.106032 type:complete len:243 (-) Transcript_35155:169-897(-)
MLRCTAQFVPLSVSRGSLHIETPGRATGIRSVTWTSTRGSAPAFAFKSTCFRASARSPWASNEGQRRTSLWSSACTSRIIFKTLHSEKSLPASRLLVRQAWRIFYSAQMSRPRSCATWTRLRGCPTARSPHPQRGAKKGTATASDVGRRRAKRHQREGRPRGRTLRRLLQWQPTSTRRVRRARSAGGRDVPTSSRTRQGCALTARAFQAQSPTTSSQCRTMRTTCRLPSLCMCLITQEVTLA